MLDIPEDVRLICGGKNRFPQCLDGIILVKGKKGQMGKKLIECCKVESGSPRLLLLIPMFHRMV